MHVCAFACVCVSVSCGEARTCRLNLEGLLAGKV